jgi:hypothetical protein
MDKRRLRKHSGFNEAGRPGPDSAGQSGDTQGLPAAEDVDSESVAELAEEGQAFEAGVISGAEGTGEKDPREITTHEVPVDDVPPEYLDEQ